MLTKADKWMWRWFRKTVLGKRYVSVGPFPWDDLVREMMKGAALGTAALLVYALLAG